MNLNFITRAQCQANYIYAFFELSSLRVGEEVTGITERVCRQVLIRRGFSSDYLTGSGTFE